MTKATHRQWRSLAEVPGDLPGLVDQVAYGDQLRVAIPYGTVRIERIGRKYEFRVFGEGGGFAWSQEFSQGEAVRKLRELADSDVRFRRIQE